MGKDKKNKYSETTTEWTEPTTEDIVIKTKPPTPTTKKTDTVKFLSWFASEVGQNTKMKPHHMSSIKAHFDTIGIKEEDTTDNYKKGLKSYGF